MLSEGKAIEMSRVAVLEQDVYINNSASSFKALLSKPPRFEKYSQVVDGLDLVELWSNDLFGGSILEPRNSPTNEGILNSISDKIEVDRQAAIPENMIQPALAFFVIKNVKVSENVTDSVFVDFWVLVRSIHTQKEYLRLQAMHNKTM